MTNPLREQPIGMFISGLIRSENPLSDYVTLVTEFDPESSPPRVVKRWSGVDLP